jgi:hypothetical protein
MEGGAVGHNFERKGLTQGPSLPIEISSIVHCCFIINQILAAATWQGVVYHIFRVFL